MMNLRLLFDSFRLAIAGRAGGRRSREEQDLSRKRSSFSS